MSQHADKWKIRFGQIFQAFLRESGKKLEEYLYFIPSGSTLDPHSEETFNLINLHVNTNFYTTYFSGHIPSIPVLNREIAARLDATLVILPGFGHHLIKTKAFGDQIPILEDLGFPVRYVAYRDSFASNERCAESVYRLLKQELNPEEKLIFFTYSKGSPVAVQMLADPRYADIADRTRAVVSFAGALRGSLLPSTPVSQAALVLLKAYRKLRQSTGSLRYRVKETIQEVLKASSGNLKELKELIKKAEEFANDLADLPEGILDLARITCQNNYARIRLRDSIKLFSISAVYPQSAFKKGFKFITNPDDLFLYISGRELYKYNVLNDTQLLLPDSKFFESTGDATCLGVVKADHWGIALSYVFSPRYVDPFPRTEMVKAVLLVLDEYFKESSRDYSSS
jgi:hypothetical protein